ncbi:hypothetical protein [Rhodococcus sp. NPDC127528]|uniref:hypothetical protein n=1 Tax=unclassified Rhodococcus (in: high G+C Gram-positive bacteria) TaxID=192944 RepID=UPI00363B5934
MSMSADDVRSLRDEMGMAAAAAALELIGSLGLVSDQVVAEIIAADRAQARAQRATGYSNLLTVEQAAERLAATVAEVQWMYRLDGLHYIHIGAPRIGEDETSIVRIHPGDLEQYIDSRRVRTS